MAGTSADVTLISIALSNGVPFRVGAGFTIIAPSGTRLREDSFVWVPTPDELSAGLPLIQALVGNLLASTGFELYVEPTLPAFVPPAV